MRSEFALPGDDGMARGGGMTKGSLDKRGIRRNSRCNGTRLEGSHCSEHIGGDTSEGVKTPIGRIRPEIHLGTGVILPARSAGWVRMQGKRKVGVAGQDALTLTDRLGPFLFFFSAFSSSSSSTSEYMRDSAESFEGS